MAPLCSTQPGTVSVRYCKVQFICSPHSSHLLHLLSWLLFAFQLRNTLKFLLGNLQGFDPRLQAVDPKQMHYIDQYMLHLLREYSIKVCLRCSSIQLMKRAHLCPLLTSLCSQVTDAYSEFDAGRVIRVLQAFITRELSSFYFSIIKDR